MSAPLVGLLGTVWGLTRSFHALADGAGTPGGMVFKEGISFNVIATAVGFAVGGLGCLVASFAIQRGNRERWFYQNGLLLSFLYLPPGLLPLFLFLNRRREFQPTLSP